jgi:hypothetical protein
MSRISCWFSVFFIIIATAKAVPYEVSVDSSSPDYHSAVLCDGKWFDKGEEKPRSDPDRLGNGGNTWVSSNEPTTHWIRLDWKQSVLLEELEIWWSLPEWHPRAFRIERLEEGRWIPIGPEGGWLAATDRRSVIPLPKIPLATLRIVQPAAGACPRGFMAAQEIRAIEHDAGGEMLQGVRRLPDRAFARLAPQMLMRNIARLNQECVGAATPAYWSPAGAMSFVEALADGNSAKTAYELVPGGAAGVQWPIEHVIDSATLIIAGKLPETSSLAFEIHDGRGWIPLTTGMKCRAVERQHRIEWSFEPTATRAARVRMLPGGSAAAIAEVEIFRYLPASKNVWPGRLIEKVGLKQQILGSPEEPSFEALALAGLSMRSARFSLGLKDTVRETGITWDGTLLGRDTLEFRIGEEQFRLNEVSETLQRKLIDEWRPGIVLEGRMGGLEVRQTAYAFPAAEDHVGPVVFVRISLRNVSNQPIKTSVRADMTSNLPGVLRYEDGALWRGTGVAFLSLSPSRAAESTGAMCTDLALAPGEESHADFVYPQETEAPVESLETLRKLAFAGTLAKFRGYWDGQLKCPTSIEVPEPRINRMVKAVLAQIFINGDGDVMPYGSAPSAYEGDLFGIEESYPMLALALFGFNADAQRYLDGTYLRDDFLRKVERYQSAKDRHQQYRNGLQPHYAVEAYRISRDSAWIGKHRALLKRCAEWTIAQRRQTMQLEKGKRPLHWGLLPKWAYGGDIYEVECYPLYANLCCWIGLRDTAWLLDELGEKELAGRYADEAREYRLAIDRAIEGSYRKDRQPPFLPLRLYADKPDERRDFYQLFAGCLLDLQALPADGEPARWISTFMEEDNRTFCFLPRYRPAGIGGLDALYGKGYLLTLLHQDSVKEFLLAFYAYLAFNMEHDTFVSRESNVLYASDLHLRTTFGVPGGDPLEISDPLPCASAVALHLVRHMLVTEAAGGVGENTGNLLLLAGAPRRWFLDGQTIRMVDVPTHYGPLSLETTSFAKTGRIEAKLSPPKRNPYHLLKLRLRHPDGLPLSAVKVNGESWSEIDRKGGWILLPATEEPYRIIAYYGD